MIISRGFGLGLASGGGQIVAGGLVVIVLCLALEGVLRRRCERLVTPRHCGGVPATTGPTSPRRQRNVSDDRVADQTVMPRRPVTVVDVSNRQELSGGSGRASPAARRTRGARSAQTGRTGTRKAGRRDVCAYTHRLHASCCRRRSAADVRPGRLRRRAARRARRRHRAEAPPAPGCAPVAGDQLVAARPTTSTCRTPTTSSPRSTRRRPRRR